MVKQKTCACCGDAVGDRHHVFERRIEVLLFGPKGPRVLVLASDDGTPYCGLNCWTQRLPTVFRDLRLTSCHPAYSVIARCSRCDAEIDRRNAHVTYAIIDITSIPEPWNTERTTHADKEFAILCPHCEFPDFGQDDDPQEQNQHPDARGEGNLCQPGAREETDSKSPEPTGDVYAL